MKLSIVLVGLMLTLGCVGQVGFLKEVVQEVFENSVTGELSVDFETYNGHIEIHLWDEQTFKVEVNKWVSALTSEEAKEKAENIRVDFSVTGTAMTLKVEEVKYAGADVVAYFPRKSFTTVELTTSNGYIMTEEITASNVSLMTSNGYIEASVTAEDITTKTSNARIKGFFQGNKVNIETSNGQIDIECGDGGQYDVKTSNARVNVKIGARGDVTVSTSNASIDLSVAGDFDFDLETSIAGIRVDAGEVTYTLDSKTHKKGFTSNEPGVSIRASTSNGSITVVKS